MTERRAPECKINYCCPYRSSLCRGICGGERGEDDEIEDGNGFIMIVMGDYCFIKHPSEDKAARYAVPEESKALFCANDRGDDMLGRKLTLNPVAKQ